MKTLHTADGERIVMDDDTADFLLGPQGEALLRRKIEADDRAAHFREDEKRAALAAECARSTVDTRLDPISVTA